MKKNYLLYVLIKNDNPIYVGVTRNIKQRLKQHKKIKNFDSYLIIKKYEKKEDALLSENAIIRYLSLFKNENNLNAKYEILCYTQMKINYK